MALPMGIGRDSYFNDTDDNKGTVIFHDTIHTGEQSECQSNRCSEALDPHDKRT